MHYAAAAAAMVAAAFNAAKLWFVVMHADPATVSWLCHATTASHTASFSLPAATHSYQ